MYSVSRLVLVNLSPSLGSGISVCGHAAFYHHETFWRCLSGLWGGSIALWIIALAAPSISLCCHHALTEGTLYPNDCISDWPLPATWHFSPLVSVSSFLECKVRATHRMPPRLCSQRNLVRILIQTHLNSRILHLLQSLHDVWLSPTSVLSRLVIEASPWLLFSSSYFFQIVLISSWLILL